LPQTPDLETFPTIYLLSIALIYIKDPSSRTYIFSEKTVKIEKVSGTLTNAHLR
jgi:hypothetical protein